MLCCNLSRELFTLLTARVFLLTVPSLCASPGFGDEPGSAWVQGDLTLRITHPGSKGLNRAHPPKRGYGERPRWASWG